MPDMKVPATVADITPEWLEAALAPRFPGAHVTAMAMDGFIDGTAQKCRFAIDYDPAGPAGPPSLWVKGGFDPKGASQGNAFSNEVLFYRDLAPLLDISLPDSFYGAIDDATNNGVVVLEDLILRGATFGRATEPLTPETAARVLSLQARLHARFWGGRDAANFRWLVPGGAIAGAGVVDQYFGFWDTARPLPRFGFLNAEQRDKPRMQAALNRLMEHLRTHPLCVLHGDSQGGNLFFNDGAPGYLDWQHSMLGHWAFDLSGFLVTSLTVADRRAHDRALVAHYLSELAAAGVEAPPFDEAWDDYVRYVMWAFMWVMCPVEAHPEAVCSANSERVCAAMADLGTLGKLGV